MIELFRGLFMKQDVALPMSRRFAHLFKYDPDQPRAPAGVETGGQWVSDSSGVGLDMSKAARYARAEEMGFDTSNTLYHGTFKDFEEFQEQFASTDAYFGPGFYFSSSPDDVNMNYVDPDSPDWDHKIEARAEELWQEADDKWRAEDEKDAEPPALDYFKKVAKEEITENGALVIQTFVRSEKTFDLSSREVFDFDENYDPETGEHGEPAGELVKIIEGMHSYAATFDSEGEAALKEVASRVMEEATNYGGLNASQIRQVVQNNMDSVYDERIEREISANDFLRFSIERAGFDSIKMNASEEFPRIVPRGGTTHTIVFKPNQVRSIFAAFNPKYKESGNILKKERILDPFVSFQSTGDAMMQLVSQLHTSRVSAYGFTAEAEVLGVEKYAISEQLEDNRICPVCILMHGKTFEVADARAALDEILHVDDPNALKSLQAWPSQKKEDLVKMRKMSITQLVDRNWHIPPFHPGCRGVLVPQGEVPDLKNTPSYQSAFPKERPEDATERNIKRLLDQLGLIADDVPKKVVRFWVEKEMGNPIMIASGLLGISTVELLAGTLGTVTFKIEEGALVLRWRGNDNKKRTFVFDGDDWDEN